jgi:hypothetical protein
VMNFATKTIVDGDDPGEEIDCRDARCLREALANWLDENKLRCVKVVCPVNRDLDRALGIRRHFATICRLRTRKSVDFECTQRHRPNRIAKAIVDEIT